MKERLINNRLFILVSFIIFSWATLSYWVISSSAKTLSNEKYREVSRKIKASLEILISEKQEAISLISFSLSHDANIMNALQKHDPKGLDFRYFSQGIQQSSHLKNIWVQVIDDEGFSLYRSWSSKRNDDLKKVRLDIARMIKKPAIINSISVGKFDLTFKSMVPIFEQNTFLGFVETLAKFNSIALKMQKRDFNIVVLVDKSYKQQLKFPFTKNFVQDYYVANLDASKDFTKYLSQQNIPAFVQKKAYHLDKNINQLITTHHLKDIHGKAMSYIVIFHNLDSIDLSSVYRTRDRLILLAVLILILLLSAVYYIYIKHYKKFMDRMNERLINEVALKTNQLEEKNKSLEHIANHDFLTKLPNRLLFIDRLEQNIRYAKRHQTSIAILFLDLDRFKEINDTFGHEVGDLLLQEITKRLQPKLRTYDTFARLGGDEFTIIIEDVQNQKVIEIIEKIFSRIKDPIYIQGNTLHISFSIGVSCFPEDGQTTEILLRNADTAMYQAKESGRNTYRFYNKDMTETISKRLSLENDLREALALEHFQAYYQPKVNAITGKVIGMEALIRWHHKTKGMIAPDKFIPLAEDLGLIAKIDQWMMKESCKTVLSWQKEGMDTGVLSLNVSVKQLSDENFVNDIKQIMKETQFNPKFLELEITESQLMKDPESTIGVLKELKALNITISIDDFGTGYSSLSYLKRLPIDKLKIDKSFIDDIPHSEDDASIVRGIIVLAQSLHLDIIAEGVENSAQKEFLIQAGSPMIQGYYYAKPLPANLFKAYLEQNN